MKVSLKERVVSLEQSLKYLSEENRDLRARLSELYEPKAKFTLGEIVGVGVVTRRYFDLKDGWMYNLVVLIRGTMREEYLSEKQVETRITLANTMKP